MSKSEIMHNIGGGITSSNTRYNQNDKLDHAIKPSEIPKKSCSKTYRSTSTLTPNLRKSKNGKKRRGNKKKKINGLTREKTLQRTRARAEKGGWSK